MNRLWDFGGPRVFGFLEDRVRSLEKIKKKQTTNNNNMLRAALRESELHLKQAIRENNAMRDAANREEDLAIEEEEHENLKLDGADGTTSRKFYRQVRLEKAKQWRQSAAGKESLKKSSRKYLSTPEGIQKRRIYAEKYKARRAELRKLKK